VPKELLFAAALAIAGFPLGALAEAWASRAIRGRTGGAPNAEHSPHRARWAASASTSALCSWIGFRYSAEASAAEWLPAILLVFVLTAITITDLRTMLIPNAIVFPAIGLAAVVRLFVHPHPYWDYAAGAIAGFGLLYALSWLSRGGIGGGDVKLYAFVGLVCGVQATLLSLLLASLAGTAFGVAARLARGSRRHIPFGPFIAGGAFLAVMYGESWIERYVAWLTR